jgi:hypothetical protein
MSRAAALVFILGVVVMLAFDQTLPRIAGVVLLLGGIAMGAFAIATPEFTADDESS